MELLMKIKTREGFEVEINDDPLETGKPYVFREKDSDEWWYGERWYGERWSGDCLNAGNKPVLEILNPSMIRKKVVIN
jgi:hypothetical protein